MKILPRFQLIYQILFIDYPESGTPGDPEVDRDVAHLLQRVTSRRQDLAHGLTGTCQDFGDFKGENMTGWWFQYMVCRCIWIIYGESMDNLWIWLVVRTNPSEKYEFVNWDEYSQYMGKLKMIQTTNQMKNVH